MGQSDPRARYLNPDTGRFNRLDPWAGNTSDPQSLHKYAYAHCDPLNGVDPSGLVMVERLAVVAAWTVISALTGASIGGVLGGIDAALDADPNRTFWDGAYEGASFGLVVGGLMPLAAPTVIAALGVVGVGAGAFATVDSFAQGNIGQGLFRGVTTLGGTAGLRQISFLSRAYRIQLINLIRNKWAALRAPALAHDAGRGARPNLRQGLGLARVEEHYGRVTPSTDDPAFDGYNDTLKRIELKGPFVAEDYRLLPPGAREEGIRNALLEVEFPGQGYDTLVVDSLGLTSAERLEFIDAVRRLQPTKPVVILPP